MEGISAEASSFAGHLKLKGLIVIYDSNDICLDGPTTECFTDNTVQRYESYGWFVQTIDGHNFNDIDKAYKAAKTTDKPALIIAKTTIGKGSPSYAGKSDIHGKAMGEDEIVKTKKAIGLPENEHFYVSEAIRTHFNQKGIVWAEKENHWQTTFNNWANSNPELAQLLNSGQNVSESILEKLENFEIKPNLASRSSSQAVIQFLAENCKTILGGSADLSCSDSTWIKSQTFVTPTNFNARNIKYGVREFAMAAIANGISLQGVYHPFCGTFLTFSDYMKNAIRLASLMNLNVTYQFTHDSIFLGEDGPTHQPIEHLASLRSIPNLTVIRPADTNEVKGAWSLALKKQGPTALILSRQSLPDLTTTSVKDVEKGAYIVKKESTPTIDICIIATGSEVNLALKAAELLEQNGKSTRVISMPSMELFDAQSESYQETILPLNAKQYAAIEAQTSFGWHKYIGRKGICITVDTFGKSAPESDLRKEFGFTVDAIVKKLS